MSVSIAETPVSQTASCGYADVPNRLVAYALDAIILTGIVFVVAAAVALIVGPTIRINAASEVQVDDGLVIVNALIGSALNATYFVLSWTKLHASPAQRLLAMRISHEADGAALTIGQATARWLLLGAPFVVATMLGLALPAVALLSILAVLAWYALLLVTTARSPRKQGLHDRYARAVVVKAMPAPPAWATPGGAEGEGVR
jgi:uncharacterized RDD family membrane protein YckC